MKTLNIIQKLSKIGKVLSKIMFIFCIIGFCGCFIGILSMVIGAPTLKIGGVTLGKLYLPNLQSIISNMSLSTVPRLRLQGRRKCSVLAF